MKHKITVASDGGTINIETEQLQATYEALGLWLAASNWNVEDAAISLMDYAKDYDFTATVS